MVAIVQTVKDSSIIKGLSETQVSSIHEQMNDPQKQSITVTEYDEDTDKTFTDIFLKVNIVKITMFEEE